MQLLTKESFGIWEEFKESESYEEGKYPVIFVSELDEVSKIVIDESDFSKYVHTDKQESHELHESNENLPWVRLVPKDYIEVPSEEE